MSKTVEEVLDGLSPDGLKAAALLNKVTLEEHLEKCHVEKRDLRRKIDDLRDALDETVIEVNGRYVTLGMIAEDPKSFQAHRRCLQQGHPLECTGDHWRQRDRT